MGDLEIAGKLCCHKAVTWKSEFPLLSFFDIKHFSNPCPKMQYYTCTFEFVLAKKSHRKVHEFITTFKYIIYNQFKAAVYL